MRVEKIVQKLLLTLLGFFMIIILGAALSTVMHSDIVSRSSIVTIAVGITGILIFALIFNLIYRLCIDVSQKKYLICMVVGFLVIMAGQLFMIKYINARPVEDLNRVTLMALYLCDGKAFTQDLEYFGMYTNNIPYTIYLSLVYKIALKFGIVDYTLVGSLLGIFALDISLMFTAFILKEIKGRAEALACVIVSVFNPAMYLWGMFFYTTIVAIMFLTCAIYISMTLNKGNKYFIWFKFFCLGIVIYIGTQIRATTIFSLIALAICVVAVIPKIYKNIKKNEKKYKIISIYSVGIVLLMVSMLLCKNMYSILEDKYVQVDYTEQEFPFTHWIMMGLAGNGSYSHEDEMQTFSLTTKQEKLDFTKAEIKRRIEKLGFNGILNLAYEKIKYTWGDGTNDYPVMLRANNNYTSLNKFILGDKREGTIIYFHIFHVALICFALLGIIAQFLYCKRIFEILPSIVLLGGIGFHLIWEANPKYSLNFMLILVYLAVIGIFFVFERVEKFRDNIKVKYTYSVLKIVGIVLSIILLFVMYKPFTKEKNQVIDIVSGQLVNSNDCIYDFYHENEVLEQTFRADRDFNTVSISMGNPYGSKDTVYKFELLDNQNNVLKSTELDGKSNIEIKKILDIDVGNIEANEGDIYTIRITPVIADDNNNLLFYFDDYDYYDVYYGGKLTYNNQILERDLGFRTALIYSGNIISSGMYIIFGIVLIIFEAVLCFAVKKGRYKEKILYIKSK